MCPISFSQEKSTFGRRFQSAQFTQFVMFSILTLTTLISLFLWKEISKYTYMSEDEMMKYIQTNNLMIYMIILLILFLGIGILGIFSFILSIKYIIALERVSRITASIFLRKMFWIQITIHINWIFALFLVDVYKPQLNSLILLISNFLHILYYMQMKKWVKDFPRQGIDSKMEDFFLQFIFLRQVFALISIGLLVFTLFSDSAPIWEYLLLSTLGTAMTGISWRFGVRIAEIF
ncbi:MAG: hypothetical protein K9W44_17260 [Candidatus Lokiarchaeota archaeon]|nr:hypothetical protein [Candidatus Harpocratesius repetitus]